MENQVCFFWTKEKPQKCFPKSFCRLKWSILFSTEDFIAICDDTRKQHLFTSETGFSILLMPVFSC